MGLFGTRPCVVTTWFPLAAVSDLFRPLRGARRGTGERGCTLGVASRGWLEQVFRSMCHPRCIGTQAKAKNIKTPRGNACLEIFSRDSTRAFDVLLARAGALLKMHFRAQNIKNSLVFVDFADPCGDASSWEGGRREQFNSSIDSH